MDNQSNDNNKKIIRSRLLKQRDALSSEDCQEMASAIVQKISTWDIFQFAKNIALYHAFRNEVDLDTLWRKAHTLGKKTYFPAITRNDPAKMMRFLEAYPHESLHSNHFNIKEPHPEAAPIDIDDLDCLFIPLVAFDNAGYRLGMGQGYYDRALASLKKRPYCVGVAYSFQEVDDLPHDPWDIPLDVVITEKSMGSF